MVTQPQQINYAVDEKRVSVPWQLQVVRLMFRVVGMFSLERAAKLAMRMMLSPRRRPAGKRGEVLLASARHSRLPFPTGDLAAYEWGHGDKTILVMHGWESNSGQMRAIIERLLAEGYRVVAFDAPAHGNSPGKEANLFFNGEALQVALEAFGPVYGIVAHSFGAASTLFHLALRPHPGLQKLVVNGSPSTLVGLIASFSRVTALPRKIVEAIHHEVFLRFGLRVESVSIAKLAHQIPTPTLMFHDRNDEFVPYAEGLDISRNWPEAQFVTTEGLMHRGALQNEDTLLQIVDFLAI